MPIVGDVFNVPLQYGHVENVPHKYCRFIHADLDLNIALP
jgi:hypothetical protein